MKQKQKAEELVDKFFIEVDSYGITDIVSQEKAKKCALICVDEMLGNYEEKYKYCESRQFLEEVKQEINKLLH